MLSRYCRNTFQVNLIILFMLYKMIPLPSLQIPGSNGTQLFLKLMTYVKDRFLNRTLSPSQRIYQMWFAVFVLRLWRRWMMSDSAYTMGNNFVSLNLYLCIEINAHALILLIIRLEDRKELFKPWLYGSQSCESYFRTARSCTPT